MNHERREMKLTVKSYLTLKRALGNEALIELEVETLTLRGLLEHLSQQFGNKFTDLVFDRKTGDLSPHISILVNGHHWVFLPERLDTQLKEGDEVALFPPIAGG
jgi:molybdopterin synthase sulfur carrier subunit